MKMKKLISVFIAVVMVFGLLPQMTMPVQAADEVYGVLGIDNRVYQTDLGNQNPTTTPIPNSIVNHLYVVDGVTTISGFAGSTVLKTVEVQGQTTIGINAFNSCSALTSVKMPNVTTISNGAFAFCSALSTVTMPLVTSIDQSAFSECRSLITVEMSKVKTIGGYAFGSCISLASVTMPEVTQIGKEAFWDCKVLSNLTVGANPPTVGTDTFLSCPTNRNLTIHGITAEAVAAYKAVDDGNTTDNLWYGWTLPAPPVYGVLKSDGKVYKAEAGTPTVPTTTVIDKMTVNHLYVVEGVTTLSGFTGITALNTVEVQGETTIGLSAFWDCKALSTVDMPKVTSIGEYAFFGCINLKTITMPNVTKIGGSAFGCCTALTNVTIQAVTEIGGSAFSNCRALANLTVGVTPPTVGTTPFADCPYSRNLTIDGSTAGAVAAYKAVDDGDTIDNFWYGWTLLAPVAPTIPASLDISKGSITVSDGTTPDTIKVIYNDGTEKTVDNLPADIPIVITGTTDKNTVTVDTPATKPINITLSGVNIDVNVTSGACAFDIQNGSSVNLTLAEGTTNTLKSGSNQAGLKVLTKDDKSATATVNINGKGSLNTTGGKWGAGIGGAAYSMGGNIIINDGNITATGGTMAAGIGGGRYKTYSNITVNGGTIVATGGNNAAGIGSGLSGTVDSGEIIISGGNVTAIGGWKGQGIGEGTQSQGATIKIDNDANVIAVLGYEAEKEAIGSVTGPSASGKTVANILRAKYSTDLDVGTTIAVKNSNGEDLTPPVKYKTVGTTKSIAFSVKNTGDYTVYNGNTQAEKQQAHKNDTTNGKFNVVEGLNPFYDVKDYVAPTTYTVTFDANEGTGTMSPQSFQVGVAQNLTSNSFIRTGYTFIGWNVNANNSGISYTDGASYTATASITLYAQWEKITPPQTNTVTVHSGTGSGDYSKGSIVTIKANTPPAGKQFKAWTIQSEDLTLPNTTSATTTFMMPACRVEVTATYEDISTTPIYDVTGTVKDNNNTTVSGATVKLMKGNSKTGETTTATDGKFKLTNVANGTYNLVVSKNGIIVTTIIVVSGKDYATGTITLPSGKTNSVVEVKPSTPQIVVGNLENQFIQADKDVVAGGGSVEIKLVAEAKNNTAPNAGNITATASSNGKIVGQFIDLSVFKTTTPVSGSPLTTTLGELPNLVVVYIPLDTALQGKTDYVIYRYHGSAVDAITTVANTDGEKIELVDGGATIKLTIKKFSTYAIAYKNATGGGPTGGGSTGGSSTDYSVIEKIIIDLPTAETFKEGDLSVFEKVEKEYNKLTNHEKSLINETLHNKYKAIAKLIEAMRKEVVNSKPTKPAPNPQTGDTIPFALPIMVMFGLGMLGIWLCGKNKAKNKR